MNIDTILRLLNNAGFTVHKTDGVFVYIEDPSCILRSFETFIDYAWIAVSMITGLLLFGWAISMIRGAKTTDVIFLNLRNLTLIFGIMAAVKPAINLIGGDDIFARGCKTVKVSIHGINQILESRDSKFNKNNANDLFEELDIYDSGVAYSDAFREIPNISNDPFADPTTQIVSIDGSTGVINSVSETVNTLSAINAQASNNDVIYTNPIGTRYKKTGGSRAWKNNNPGNIRFSQFARNQGAIGEAGGFAVFPDEAAGMNAISALLQSKNYKNLTIEGAISRWAPPIENDTAAYKKKMEKLTGININTKISDLSATQLQSIVGVIKTIEGWKIGKQINI